MLECRVATLNDAAQILSILEEVAPEIPVALDNPEAREVVISRIKQCCSFGETCVAANRTNRIVGFLLVEPEEMERFLHDNQALHLPYGGVTKTWRNQGTFQNLIEMVMSRHAPLTATVKRENRCKMAPRLIKIGFTKVSCNAQEDKFRWQPRKPRLVHSRMPD
jgi:hypothetical protein